MPRHLAGMACIVMFTSNGDLATDDESVNLVLVRKWIYPTTVLLQKKWLE